MKHFILIGCIFLAQTNFAQSVPPTNPFAQPVNFPAVNVTELFGFTKLPTHQYLTAIYAVGNPDFVEAQSDNIHIFRIYDQVANIPISGDTVLLPAKSVLWSGVWRPNMLVLVVHSEPNFTWKNLTGSQPNLPSGIVAGPNSNYTSVATTSVVNLTSLQNANPGQTITFPFKPLLDADGN